jgi:crossover junction endodeoxyribonuclease RuvC
MIYIGIDPGQKGAMAFIGDAGITVIPFDEGRYLGHLKVLAHPPCAAKAVVEHVNAMPGQGVTSMFNFGKGFGWLLGVLDAYGIPYELVRPQKWKKEYSVTGDKNSSIAVCKRLFPEVSLLPTTRCKKDSDGMAEALLMAEYARRRL